MCYLCEVVLIFIKPKYIRMEFKTCDEHDPLYFFHFTIKIFYFMDPIVY